MSIDPATPNNTATPFSDELCVHHLIAEQSLRTPEATAVEFATIAITYRELDDRANQFAHHLVRIGATPGTLIGVQLERSGEVLIALLGILKAACAYVPLDPGFPPDRLALMVEDSGLPILVTQRGLRGTLSLGAHIRVVEIDGDRDVIASEPRSDPRIAESSRELMYVIYTSGSTGRPKGVAVEHRSVVNFLETMAESPGIAAGDRLLAVTTLSFDIAGLELFLPLITGATVVIASAGDTIDPKALIALLTTRAITVMQATPATWRMLIEGGWTGDATLRVLCGGEALPEMLATSLIDRVAELWNMYGPTETTIWSTMEQVQQGTNITIGRPIANTAIYVLDDQRAPVAPGAVGELYIGGAGLARGYHDRPDLTAERFVEDPFETSNGSRMYRTGDLVRSGPDGRIEFLGRADQQVKVNGFRIELGEIEAVISRDAGIEDVVVLAKTDPAGEKRLVAYVVRRAPTESVANASNLRRAVQDVLPRYMVPSRVVFLDAMPRTPNAKTDRNALPDPDWSLGERDIAYIAARDEIEAHMTQLWQDELHIDNVGVHDDFFELGIESIVAARLFARIEAEFGIHLPIGTVFANPTVEGLANIVRSRADTQLAWPSLVPIQTKGAKTPWFGIHGGAGTILLYSELARRLEAHDQPFYGLQAQGLYGRDPVHTRIPEMATAYISQIREVQPHGPYVLIGYCFGAFVAYEIAQQFRAMGESVDLVASINGPSLAYIYRHDPDNLLGLNDEDGQPDPDVNATKPHAGAFPLKVRLRKALVKRVRNLQLAYVIHFRKPMPEVLRENSRFQKIAMRSQFHYEPKPYDGPFLVLTAAGLYAEPDLGWSETTSHTVRCVEVPGAQPVPRATMKEPTVGFVANQLLENVANENI